MRRDQCLRSSMQMKQVARWCVERVIQYTERDKCIEEKIRYSKEKSEGVSRKSRILMGGGWMQMVE